MEIVDQRSSIFLAPFAFITFSRHFTSLFPPALKDAKDNFLSSTLPSMLKTNPKQFWRMVNPKYDNIIALSDLNGDAIPANQCPGVLNEVFAKHFSLPSNSSPPHLRPYDHDLMFPLIISYDGVASIIRSLKPSFAPGCDQINVKFLQSPVCYTSIILTKIFLQSLHDGLHSDGIRVEGREGNSNP